MSTITIGRTDEVFDEDYTLHEPLDGTRKRVWRIVRKGAGHKTFAGIYPGGAIQETAYTFSKPKNVGRLNATTGAEQASLDIIRKITRKLKDGMVSDQVLPVDPSSIRKWKSPTLAHKWVDRKHKLVYPVYVSPKLDGIRCVTTQNGMFSRDGNEFISCPHIWKTVKPLFDIYPDLVIDGELYFHTDDEDNFDRLSGLVKRKKLSPADIKEAEVMQYWVFDIIPQVDPYTTPFSERYKQYFEMFAKDKFDHNIVRPVFQRVATTEGEVTHHSLKFIEQFFEGGMVRSHNAMYVHDRVNDLIKYKLFIDDEYMIDDVIEGEGNLAGKVGKFIMATIPGKHNTPSGKVEKFKCAPTGSHAQWEKWWNDRELMKGTLGTVNFQNLTPRGVPRFGKLKAVRDYE